MSVGGVSFRFGRCTFTVAIIEILGQAILLESGAVLGGLAILLMAHQREPRAGA